MIAGRQQEGHEPRLAVRRQSREDGGRVRLLHVDEGTRDLELRSGGGDSGDEAGDRGLPVG